MGAVHARRKIFLCKVSRLFPNLINKRKTMRGAGLVGEKFGSECDHVGGDLVVR